MKTTIVPSIIATTQKELSDRYKKVQGVKRIHLDFMDGKYVPSNSLEFNFRLPPGKYKVEGHLMVLHPKLWIGRYGNKLDIITIHIESCATAAELKNIISIIKRKKKKVGLAISPKTQYMVFKKFIPLVDQITIMTVHPGFYGSLFLPDTLKKVKAIRKAFPTLDIQVDGGISLETIGKAKAAGANLFVSGSYLQNSKDVTGAIKALQKAARKA
jgi:ribulose-phosphate 3-epimerase